MSIDWRALITTGSFSAIAVAATVFVLKHTFETVLTSAAKRIEENAKVTTAEAIRRQAAIFDQQLSVLKSCAAAVYRARNAARDLRDSALSGTQTQLDADTLQHHHDALQELLFQERAILPQTIFTMLHTQGHYLEKLQSAIRNSGASDFHQKIESAYFDIDRTYERLTTAIHEHLGIHAKDS
jgi:hypothetical protein